MNDTTNNARAHLKPKRLKVWTVGWGEVAEGLLAIATQAGEAGMTWADIKTTHPTWKPQTISGGLNRHLETGALIRRGKGGQIRYWLGTVSAEVADAIHAQDCERSRQRRSEMRRVYSEKHRRAVGDMTRAEYVAYQKARAEAAKSEKARQRVERAAAKKLAKDAERNAKQDAEARAAIRKEKAEARKLAADLARLEALEAKAKPTKPKLITRETQRANRLAEKFRGTVSPTAIVAPLPKPGPVDIPPHLIKKCPAMTLPHERIQPAGVIPKERGRYSDEASTWAKAVAA